MSQQEFVPEPQGQSEQSSEHEEIYTQPYYWSTKPKSGGILKDEHPSTFEESIPPYSYPAQDSTRYRQQRDNVVDSEPAQKQRQRQQFSPDGDAFEQGYRPYTQYNRWQQVPPWAQPQRHQGRHVLRWIVLIVLGLALLKPLLVLVGILLAGVIGIALFAILLPILIALMIAIIVAMIALVVMTALGIPIGRGRRRWGGPRGWRRW